MNREVSSGGVIVYASRGAWFVLLMKDMKGNWTFPKGKIEAGEETVETAKREIAEEVGISGLTFVAELTPVKYWYFRKIPIRKTVQYYVFRAAKKQKPTVQTEEGIKEAKWVTFPEALNIIGYRKSNEPILTEAIEILERHLV